MKYVILIILIFFAPSLYAQAKVHFNLNDFAKNQILKGEVVKLNQPLTNPWRIELQDSLMFF